MLAVTYLEKFVKRLAYKIQKKLSKIKFNFQQRRFQKYGPDHQFPRTTADWLIHREIIYGGIQKNVSVRIASPHDPRSKSVVYSEHMRGGDRMLFHGYAKHYARLLKYFDFDKRLVIAEFGILRGNGLAIWCDLFPNARILGFDIDMSHFEDNRKNLLDRGAFSVNSPEVYEYDQFKNGQDLLRQILKGDSIDICIDDGCHVDEAILCTLESVVPHLNPRFLYFIEDNKSVYKKVKTLYPRYRASACGELTILSEKLSKTVHNSQEK